MRYSEAIQAFEDGLSSNPSSERLHVWLAASYAKAGMVDKARWETEQINSSIQTSRCDSNNRLFLLKSVPNWNIFSMDLELRD